MFKDFSEAFTFWARNLGGCFCDSDGMDLCIRHAGDSNSSAGLQEGGLRGTDFASEAEKKVQRVADREHEDRVQAVQRVPLAARAKAAGDVGIESTGEEQHSQQ